jgi:choline dehydrogenase-like flavoprotein
MLIDFSIQRELPSYDLCIVGSGPAGITLAMKMAGAGWKVALLEAGGLEYSDRSQRLYAALGTGSLYPASTRLRFLGGTSNHWTGRCRPFDPFDFERVPAGGLPGWPVRFEEIEAHLAEAMRILDLPPAGFQASNGPMADGQFTADRSAMSPPTRFAGKYLGALRELPNLHLVINCNCVGLMFDAAGRRVSAVEAVDYRGGRSAIRAKQFILATGAIENPRILLASEGLMAQGAGGRMVGRCFMEHLNVHLGEFVYANADAHDKREYYTSDAFLQSHGVGAGNVSFGILDQIESYGRTAAIKSFLKRLSCDAGVADKVQFIANFTCPGAGRIGTLIEQAPVLDGSRVTLAGERDDLGMRKARVDWRLTDVDRRTIRAIGLEVAKSFARSGLGMVKLRDYIVDASREIPVSPHAHHMGTTRMARSPQWGVVNADCKVFGTRNLYVAGSSIFSTGGACNPTMPLLQFALRLADHLITGGREPGAQDAAVA